MVRALAVVFLLAVLSAGAPLAAQTSPPNLNTSRLARFDPYDAYNDVWGYTAPDGREYACVGLTTGFIVVNCTDPIEPYLTGHFPGAFCTWRDLKTYGHYLYVVNDCTAGIDVVDLSDPENPVYVNKFALTQVLNAHNVAIDTDAGILYAVGTNNGMQVYDLDVNPTNPPRIEVWGPTYVHDVSVQDGLAHAALIWAGDYRVLNVSNPSNITTIASLPSGAEFTHSTWPNADNTLVVAADETPGSRHLAFYNTTNPSNPVKVGQYTEDSQSIPHNPYIRGEICHVSWYTEGYIAIDISNPDLPVKVGRYDTQPNTPSGGVTGFNGAWGCYPFTESGFVYVSDRQRGLFVVSFNECAVGLPDLPQPQICRVWPETVSALQSPRQRVILTGKGFENATSVNVGGTVLPPALFTVINDQAIHFRMPLVANPGPNAISVTSPGGTSLSTEVEVTLPAGIVLDTGPVEQVEGDTLIVAIGSQPGDLYYPVLAFSPLPSVVPGTVAFDIGNNFTALQFLDPLAANAAGVSGFGLIIPPGALGVSVYWQVAVIDPQVGLPATVTNWTTTTIVEPLE